MIIKLVCSSTPVDRFCRRSSLVFRIFWEAVFFEGFDVVLRPSSRSFELVVHIVGLDSSYDVSGM